MMHSLSSPKRALWVLPVALGLMIVALVASPAAQAHGKSWKHHGAKSGKSHKSGESHKKRHAHKNSSSGTVSVVDGKTKLSVDKDTGAALGSLGIAVEPIDPARVSRRGAFRFPITGGEVDAKTLAGQIQHSGGLAFVKGSTRVELTDFFINIDAEPDLTAIVGGSRVSVLSLDLSNLERKDRGNKVLLSGIEASLTAGAAAALNSAFSTSAFQEGLLIGTAQVKAYVHKAAKKPRGDDDDDDNDDHRGGARDDDDNDDHRGGARDDHDDDHRGGARDDDDDDDHRGGARDDDDDDDDDRDDD